MCKGPVFVKFVSYTSVKFYLFHVAVKSYKTWTPAHGAVIVLETEVKSGILTPVVLYSRSIYVYAK